MSDHQCACFHSCCCNSFCGDLFCGDSMDWPAASCSCCIIMSTCLIGLGVLHSNTLCSVCESMVQFITECLSVRMSVCLAADRSA